MSTWVRAAYAFSYEGPAYGKDADGKLKAPPLAWLAKEIGVSYRTVLLMRDRIKYAAGKYKGYKTGFGLLPRSFMKHRSKPTADYRYRKQKLLEEGKHPSQHAIRSTGVLESFMPESTKTETRADLGRTEQLLRLLLGTSKPNKKRSPRSTSGRDGACGNPQGDTRPV